MYQGGGSYVLIRSIDFRFFFILFQVSGYWWFVLHDCKQFPCGRISISHTWFFRDYFVSHVGSVPWQETVFQVELTWTSCKLERMLIILPVVSHNYVNGHNICNAFSVCFNKKKAMSNSLKNTLSMKKYTNVLLKLLHFHCNVKWFYVIFSHEYYY